MLDPTTIDDLYWGAASPGQKMVRTDRRAIAKARDVSRERRDEWGMISQNQTEAAIAAGVFEHDLPRSPSPTARW